ncbi:uncharacterized protein PAC_00017 [Phialocephala subalpina]|uniref:Uncharacterized protein n=1 Tax=Phialocephala subalpina TaxID=576137 RepID=A0A1L7WBI8_9HELO|nr:uncharacterized protein PAC_00017 [Phialocephala subalpina]
MDQERQTKVASALQQYRETVSQHNIMLIRAVVRGVETQPVPPSWSEKDAQQLRMQEFCRVLQVNIPESVTARQILHDDDVLAELIQRYDLDGVVAPNPDNLEQREEFFANIRKHIPETVDLAEFPPADLAYLCTLVSGITGPGISYHRYSQQFDFISPIKDAQQLEKTLEGVVVPIRSDYSVWPLPPSEPGVTYNQLTDIWEDWEIAVVFNLGRGPRVGGGYALYCRREAANDEAFKWRYGVQDEEWYSDVYDSIEEFLGFYAHFNEQTEQEIAGDIRPLIRGRVGYYE